jgi:hypothetical protein
LFLHRFLTWKLYGNAPDYLRNPALFFLRRRCLATTARPGRPGLPPILCGMPTQYGFGILRKSYGFVRERLAAFYAGIASPRPRIALAERRFYKRRQVLSEMYGISKGCATRNPYRKFESQSLRQTLGYC